MFNQELTKRCVDWLIDWRGIVRLPPVYFVARFPAARLSRRTPNVEITFVA